MEPMGIRLWTIFAVLALLVALIENTKVPNIKILGMDNRKFSNYVSNGIIFSVKPHKKEISKIWSTAQLIVKSEKTCKISEDFNISTLTNSKNQFSFLSAIVSKLKSFQEYSDYKCQHVILLPLFNNYTIEIEVDGNLDVEYKFTYVDVKLVTLFLLGILLFYSANKLSKNEIFQYFSGTSIGIMGSILLLLILFVRFIPKKSTATLAFLSGSSFFLFIMRWLYLNFKNLTESFQLYIIGYLLLSGIVSATYCYYRGPIKNERGINIINFFLKFFGIALIYLGTSNNLYSISLLIAFFIVNSMYKFKNFGSFGMFRRIKYKYFPEKRKLLTQEEYLRQGQEYTNKALNELREYCTSPECNAWRTISRISQPSKFAKFISDSSYHLSDEELFEYEDYSISNDLIDDED
ncbi:unnamed protein product [Brachionus calyciflorus]|uniref:Nuclear envelope integral membrane protein 1 n=1 Tax=Brachionus calyciflorus TaxID=104777 RepID=A0A813M485_9BILA|nr:unnamed protein product [Brachionus calyciflorus]